MCRLQLNAPHLCDEKANNIAEYCQHTTRAGMYHRYTCLLQSRCFINQPFLYNGHDKRTNTSLIDYFELCFFTDVNLATQASEDARSISGVLSKNALISKGKKYNSWKN